MSGLEEAKRQAQKEVAECEKEIGAIKAIVKSLAGPGTANSQQQHQQQQQQQQDPEMGDALASSSSSSANAAAAADAAAGNTLTVVLLKVEGLTDESKEEEEEQSSEKKLHLSLQLSSPIEEGVLSEIFNPELQQDDAVPETMKVTFRGVETNQATLTLTATRVSPTAGEAPVLLGTSESIDLSSMTKLDAMNPNKEYVTDLPLVITPEAKEDEAGDDEQTTTTSPPSASCTVTIRLTFVPSQKDVLEELYELLNKATTRKTRAVDKLRQIAVMASRQSATAGQQQMMTRQQQPAVRSGFLNKTATKPKEPPKLQVFYDCYLGPQTLWRQMLPLAKNYIVFFVAVTAMHFKGHNLALPPPV